VGIRGRGSSFGTEEEEVLIYLEDEEEVILKGVQGKDRLILLTIDRFLPTEQIILFFTSKATNFAFRTKSFQPHVSTNESSHPPLMEGNQRSAG
jgi:hypothetical protein